MYFHKKNSRSIFIYSFILFLNEFLKNLHSFILKISRFISQKIVSLFLENWKYTKQII